MLLYRYIVNSKLEKSLAADRADCEYFVQKQKLHSDLSISTIKSNGYRWLTCGYNNTIKWLVLNSWFVAIGKRWVPGSKNVKWLRKVKIDIDGVSPSASVNECSCQEKFWLVVWHGIARSSNWMRRKLYNIEAFIAITPNIWHSAKQTHLI